MSQDALYRVADLCLVRRSGNAVFELMVPHMQIRRGECVALVGPSGCGKSTLLDALSLVSRPASVARFDFFPVADQQIDLADLISRRDAEDKLASVRKRWMGYVLQRGGLLPFLSVEGNIRVSRRLLGLADDGEVNAIAQALDIADQLRARTAHLSVGQRQRVAIARAIAHKPAIVIADEPTAALDPCNADRVMELLKQQVERYGSTLIIASHDVDRVERFGLRRLSLTIEEDSSTGRVRAIFQD